MPKVCNVSPRIRPQRRRSSRNTPETTPRRSSKPLINTPLTTWFRPPYPNREGIVETLKLSQNPEARKANPNAFLDSSVVKTLEDQGFLRQIGMQK